MYIHSVFDSLCKFIVNSVKKENVVIFFNFGYPMRSGRFNGRLFVVLCRKRHRINFISKPFALQRIPIFLNFSTVVPFIRQMEIISH